MIDLDEVDDNGHLNEDPFKFEKLLEYSAAEVEG